jgi:hypothetical protein
MKGILSKNWNQSAILVLVGVFVSLLPNCYSIKLTGRTVAKIGSSFLLANQLMNPVLAETTLQQQLKVIQALQVQEQKERIQEEEKQELVQEEKRKRTNNSSL